ncbi:probable disease resistance protein At1g52660 [Vitis vinifera]|uniref:TIR domain-containing protein n=1 Tax=Vitis vinifera TaxID=29760 RepID=F6I433_VITVI|nr:probable disease resistance protein At1g52660 [Vitis vinifera]|eukprot:XP_003634573.1 PREDICTED: probable disease resistance protein At1g52660 [Vitis vinifera]
MDCINPILDVAITATRAAHGTGLPETLEYLRDAMVILKHKANDVKAAVDYAEENRKMRRTHEVSNWLLSVEVLEKEVMEILQKGDREIQQKCLGTRFPKNYRSSYKIEKIASETIGVVTELRHRGDFSIVVIRLPRADVDERPMEKTVGLDRMYAEVCRCIQDEEPGIIGLYGMGGTGKTTLMTKVNNEFLCIHDFEVVIWVVVSRPATVGKVQEVIRNKLDIPDDRWGNRTEDEKAVEIFKILKAKRFVMLLDDVWERLDLKKVGIPSPNSQNRSKVILTTRSRDVCRDMEAQQILEMERLTQDDAINLFMEKVGKTTLNSHPDIPQLAEIAAKECQGLPLALVTIGRAMAGKNSPQEWEPAIRMLKTYSSKFSASTAAPFASSQWSYDVFLSFRGEDTRFTFAAHLYVALHRRGVNTFFDDHKIRRGESISPTLVKAIEGSRSSIILLSQNYAGSSWCLEELVKILECRKTMGQLVLPIFYNVDPSDVRRHKGSFGEALVKHENTLKHDIDKVKNWREALSEVANLAGWNSQNKSEPTFLKEIVIDVLKRVFGLSAGDAKAIVKEDSRIQNKEVVPGPHSTTVHIAGQSGISARGRRPPIENVGEELIDSDSDSGYDDVESILTKVWTNL